MSDPSNPNGGWQDVPNTSPDPAASNVPPAGAYQAPPNYPPQQPPPGYAQPAAAGLSSNGAAAISYLTFVPAIIFLVMDPYKRDPFVRFHAIQCLALTVLWVVVGIVLTIVAIPFALGGMYLMFHLLHELVSLAFVIIWLICIINAAQGKWFKIPVIGDFALKQSKS
jgi:uncharacterized membrane protein